MHRIESYIRLRNVDRQISKDTIVVEHRSNNPKRDYLFVNKRQGKHIPTNPKLALEEFEALSNKVKEGLPANAKVLVVGFAETATAIGSAVAYALGSKCVYRTQTTRCIVEGSKKLVEFSEEHSHATQQYFYGDWDNIPEFNYILFVEDEISTGKTIMNFVNRLREIHPDVMYGVASICNWQSLENQKIFKDNGIQTFALIYGELIDEKAKMSVHVSTAEFSLDNSVGYQMCQEVNIGEEFGFFRSERAGCKPDLTYRDKVVSAVTDTAIKLFGAELNFDKSDSLCVIGTEENMYYPILVADELQSKLGIKVVTHSTTRSSIDVSEDSTDIENGIINKAVLMSPYGNCSDEGEAYRTFIYNLRKYSKVLIITDGTQTDKFNMSLCAALEHYGNNVNNIKMIKIG